MYVVEVRIFERYVHVIKRPEATAIHLSTTFDHSLGSDMRNGVLTVSEQNALERLTGRYQRALNQAIHALSHARPTVTLAAANRREVKRLRTLQRAVRKLRSSLHRRSAAAYRSAYVRFLRASRARPRLPALVDKRATSLKGRGVFNRRLRRPSLHSRAARALVGTWYGQQDGVRLTISANGRYSTPNGGGGTWRPTSDGIQFTGTEKYNGGHAIVRAGAMEFYWRNANGSIDYFVYLKG